MTLLIKLLDSQAIVLACFIGWLTLWLPALMYLIVNWRMRRQTLLNYFSVDAIILYYRQFRPFAPQRIFEREDSEKEDVKTKFKRHFDSRYGRRHYILPLLLLALAGGVGMWVTAKSVQSWLGFIQNPKAFSPVAISAFLGAYAWVLNDHLARFRTGDFTYHDVYGGVYRLLIAIPLGLSLATFSNLQVAAGVAFLLAAFPTTTLFKFARRLASKNIGVAENDESGRLELEKLQCIGRSNAERYGEEGISTIVELAWADPIDLTIRTNREFNYVVDCISQALLWVYFEDEVKKLYAVSLRGAQDVSSLLRDLLKDDVATKAALTAAASRLNLNEDAFKYSLLTVAEDPHTKFLVAIWAQIEKGPIPGITDATLVGAPKIAPPNGGHESG
ncbi:MAG TPA: hypothetical protein VNO50_13295 [Pyrinomonadaceae bacterium]|nr:hypothetical protein [Pyrinomonadaceae bacterium]